MTPIAILKKARDIASWNDAPERTHAEVLQRFPNGEKVWLPLSQINQVPASWALPESMAQRRGKYLLITDWIAKQKGFKITPRELDIDPEREQRVAEVKKRLRDQGVDPDQPSAPAQTTKPELLVDGKPFAVAALEQQIERQAKEYAASLRLVHNDLDTKRAQVCQTQLEYARARSELRDAQAQRDKAVADLALAQDALRKANERADKAEAYIAAQGRSHRAETSQERFMLLELE